mgnify:CR=1 FL=1
MALAAAIYILATLLANYTAMWFVPLPVFGMVAVGTLVFGITFTQRDRLHHHGRRTVYTVIALAALANSLESVLLDIPPRIILASFTAIVLAELADTEVYQRHVRRPWLGRVAISNAVSIPLDSLLFNLIAFAGVFEPAMLIAIVLGEIVVKTLVGGVTALWRDRSWSTVKLATAGWLK